ncbi:MAG: GerMN domain-containing protein [Acidobacteriota bacterium]
MSRREPTLPWRVITISLMLAAVLGLLGYLVIGRFPAAGGGAPASAADDAGGGPETGAAGKSPAVADEAGHQAASPQQPGISPPAQPPPLAPEKLESLTAAAAERAAKGTMSLQLYLVVPQLERLIPVTRLVTAPRTLDDQVQRAVEELISWEGNEMISPLPADAPVREAWVSPGGIAYVDFDKSFPASLTGGALGEIQAVYGVVDTITSSFPEIRAVQILVDGQEIDTLGHLDLSRPLLPSFDWAIREPGIQPSW